MSYILDALKRADAQRDRGQVPGLNAQPMAVTPVARATLRPWLWLGGGVAVVAVGAALWRMNAAPAPATPAASVPAPAVALAAAPAPSPSPSPAPLPSPSTSPVPAPAPKPAPKSRPSPAPAPAAAATPSPAPVPTPPPAPAPAAARVFTLAELPENIRTSIPKLNVSGSVYSGNAAQRMLIVNGQVLNEGSTVAPDLVLETIGQRDAVLNYRGTRVRVNY